MKLVFEPEKWHGCDNDWPVCPESVNCYSYALNDPNYHWSSPGLGYVQTAASNYHAKFSDYFEGLTAAEFRKAMVAGAIEDGLRPVKTPIDRAGHYLTALFFADSSADYDYHWYRKDDDGTWSHKNGWRPASRHDAHGQIILEPRQGAEADCPVFGGFFLAPRTGITLSPALWLGLAHSVPVNTLGEAA